jgi:hypothetical protein
MSKITQEVGRASGVCRQCDRLSNAIIFGFCQRCRERLVRHTRRENARLRAASEQREARWQRAERGCGTLAGAPALEALAKKFNAR